MYIMCRYDSTWYYIPIKAQKVLLFIMLRSSKECEINLPGLFVAGYEDFSTVIFLVPYYINIVYIVLFNFNLLKSFVF